MLVGEVGLAYDDIGGLVHACRKRLPDQDAIVIGIRHREHRAISRDSGRRVKRVLCGADVRKQVTGLSKENRRAPDAYRAFTVHRRVLSGNAGRRGKTGHTRVAQDTVVIESREHHITVCHPQSVSPERNAARGAKNVLGRRALIQLIGEILLSYNQSRGLTGQICRLAENGGTRQKKSENRLHE